MPDGIQFLLSKHKVKQAVQEEPSIWKSRADSHSQCLGKLPLLTAADRCMLDARFMQGVARNYCQAFIQTLKEGLT